MTATRSITAGFKSVRTLTVAKAGSGAGTLTSTATGTIDCGTSCSTVMNTGLSVRFSTQPFCTAYMCVTPAAAPGSEFVGWSGPGCSATPVLACDVEMSSDTTITATFAIKRLLTVAKAGSGTGSVTSAPAGIDCGATCSASFVEGSTVALTAAPAAGSRFAGWSGGGCSGTGACEVTMTGAPSVTATFVARVTLVLSVIGSGAGSATSAPAGIDCPAGCTAQYDQGTTVKVTAAAAPGSLFAGFGFDRGCQEGAGIGITTCTLTLNSSTDVSVYFSLPRILSVTKTGTGTGTVIGESGELDCGAVCSYAAVDEQGISLKAVPAAGSKFSGWSVNGCPARLATCGVLMLTDMTVTATFDLVSGVGATPTPIRHRRRLLLTRRRRRATPRRCPQRPQPRGPRVSSTPNW